MSGIEQSALRGDGRRPGGAAERTVVTLEATGFSVTVGDAPPWRAAYRDVTTIALEEGVVLLQLGDGPAAERWLLERFGPATMALVRGLRDGRLRQWLADGLVPVPDREPIELVEVEIGTASGVAQLLYHDRGAVLAPLDERLPRLRIRRADIGSVVATPGSGRLEVGGAGGPLASTPLAVDRVALCGLGSATTRHRDRWAALRDGAAADLSTIVGALIPDAPFDVRRQAAGVLREGHPADAAMLGAGWSALEAAVLAEPTFAESYRELLARAGGPAATRWLAVAPSAPGVTQEPRLWFLVGLPGNLVALELVSGGSHATYVFRVSPRATFAGGPGDPTALAAAVREISEALIDGRFLREPLAIPEARLAEAAYLRYRLALRALPSLAAARRRFVARIVHRDAAQWAAALDDLVRWHGRARDEGAEWPGRSLQESQIDAAGEPPPEG